MEDRLNVGKNKTYAVVVLVYIVMRSLTTIAVPTKRRYYFYRRVHKTLADCVMLTAFGAKKNKKKSINFGDQNGRHKRRYACVLDKRNATRTSPRRRVAYNITFNANNSNPTRAEPNVLVACRPKVFALTRGDGN